MKNLFIVLLTLTIATSACAQVKVDQKKEAEALMEANRQWAKAASPEAFFSFIRPDALMMAPDIGIAKGHEEMGKVLAGFQALPGFHITWEPQEAYVAGSGDLGYSVDRILVSFDGEDGKKVEIYEKGLSVWKKDDQGDWKMAIDIWNVDTTINSIYK